MRLILSLYSKRAEAENEHPESISGPQVTSLLGTCNRQPSPPLGEQELPFQLHKAISISNERVSKEYPASLFTAKQKGITHSTLFPMAFGWGREGSQITTYSHQSMWNRC